MNIRLENQDIAIAYVFGLMKFNPSSKFHHVVFMLTPDSVVIFDDEHPDRIEAGVAVYTGKYTMPLASISASVDEEAKGNRDFNGYHRLSFITLSKVYIALFVPPNRIGSLTSFVRELARKGIKTKRGNLDLSPAKI